MIQKDSVTAATLLTRVAFSVPALLPACVMQFHPPPLPANSRTRPSIELKTIWFL
jgi:hypothetical protein